MSGSQEARLAAGAQFGAYRVVRPLGEGAAGAVYEVVKTSVGKRMALKVLHRSLHDGGDDLVRFQREAMIAGTLEHPNVVQVFDVGELDGYRYMAMELLEGETLEDRIARERALPVRDVADLFVPLLSALGAVHDRGIVHRDLKPGNIFLVARRPGVVEPKLLDFGVIKDLSGIVGGDITRAHSMVGSPAYMSPEQAEHPDAIDVRSDQFTMGSILWECLIGRKLFEGDTLYQVLFQVAEGPIPPPASWRHDVPKSFEAVVLRALERDPALRFGSIREMGAALLPHCSEHVRAVWREELEPYAPPEPTTEQPEYDDDQPTKMIPTAFDSASGMRAPTPMGLAAPQVSASVVAPYAPPMTPASSPAPPQAARVSAPSDGRSSAPPMPHSALPQAASTSWPGAAPAGGSFPGAETFQPRARAVTQVLPPQKSRAPWGIAFAVVAVLALAVTVVALTQRAAPDAPPATTPHAAVAPPTPPPTAAPPPATPAPVPAAAADAGATAPAAPSPAAARTEPNPRPGPRGRRGRGNK